MTSKKLIEQLDSIVTKKPKSDWSKYKRHIVDEAINMLTQKPVIDEIKAEIEQLPITDTAIRLVDEVLDKYNVESEVTMDKWIPCSERLPNPQEEGEWCKDAEDFSDWVLVSVRVSEDHQYVCSAYYCFDNHKWYTSSTRLGDVIAWMPMPEPWEGETK